MGFTLICFQRLSFPYIATLALPLAWQQIHQRYVRSGPLVLGTALSIFLRPRRIGTELFLDVLNPARVPLLMGEQPNPWKRLHLQDVTSRHRGAKHHRLCELLGGISLLSPGNFYPLSDDHSILNRLITKSCFRTCLTRRSRSQRSYAFTLLNDFQPFWGNLWTPPLLFRRRPPQSNYPPDTVPVPVSRY